MPTPSFPVVLLAVLALAFPATSRTRLRAAPARAAGDSRRAIEVLQAALHRDPNQIDLHVRLAYAYHAIGADERSAVAAAEASSLESDPVAAWRERIAVARARGNASAAVVGARELARLLPGACEPWRIAAGLAAEWPAASGARPLERAATFCPLDPEVLAARGRELIAGGCAAEAVTVLERAIDAGRDLAGAADLLSLARAQVAARFAEIDAGLRAIEAEVSRSLAGRGFVSGAATGLWLDLRQQIGRERRDEVDDPETAIRLAELYRLGDGLGMDGSRAQAEDQVGRALWLRPAWPRALILRGVLALAAEPPQPGAAERAFRAAIDAAGAEPPPSAWSGLFLAYLRQGRLTEAAEAADRYLAMAPEDRDIAALREEMRGGAGEARKERRR